MSKLTDTMIAHLDFDDFQYDQIVDWAIELLEENIESENIEIAAGLQKPVNVFEARKYIELILEELKIPKYEKDERIQKYCRQYIWKISQGIEVRINLGILSRICISLNYDKDIYDFCSLYWAWGDLDYQEDQYYWPDANKQNIESIAKEVAQKWIDIKENKAE